MPKPKCVMDPCDADATHYMNVDAYVARRSNPITMLIGLPICEKHIQGPEILTPEMWDILDTWAIQGRRGLCDRELVDVYGVRISDPEFDIRAHQNARRRLAEIMLND